MNHSFGQKLQASAAPENIKRLRRRRYYFLSGVFAGDGINGWRRRRVVAQRNPTRPEQPSLSTLFLHQMTIPEQISRSPVRRHSLIGPCKQIRVIECINMSHGDQWLPFGLFVGARASAKRRKGGSTVSSQICAHPGTAAPVEHPPPLNLAQFTFFFSSFSLSYDCVILAHYNRFCRTVACVQATPYGALHLAANHFQVSANPHTKQTNPLARVKFTLCFEKILDSFCFACTMNRCTRSEKNLDLRATTCCCCC